MEKYLNCVLHLERWLVVSSPSPPSLPPSLWYSHVDKGSIRTRPAKVKSGTLRHTLPRGVAQQPSVAPAGSKGEEGPSPRGAGASADLQPDHLDSTHLVQDTPLAARGPPAVLDASSLTGRAVQGGPDSSVVGWSSSPGSSQESAEGSPENDVFLNEGEVELSWSARAKAKAPRGRSKPCSVPSSTTASPVPRKASLSKSAKERILGHKLKPLEKPRPPSGALAQKPPLPPRDAPVPSTEPDSPLEPNHFVVKTEGACTPPCELTEGERGLDVLAPFANPEQALTEALQGLASSDW